MPIGFSFAGYKFPCKKKFLLRMSTKCHMNLELYNWKENIAGKGTDKFAVAICVDCQRKDAFGFHLNHTV